MRALVLAIVLVLVGCGTSAPESTVSSGSADTPDVSAPPSRSPAPTAAKPPRSDSPPASPAPRSTSSTRAPRARLGTKIIVADSQYGAMLYDASGQAIYLFDAERSTRPECYGDCAVAWPPVLTDGKPQAASRVRSALLATTPRRDGTTQVTYAGHPLYFYAEEGKYEVLCHNIEGFGGTWLVVQPDGDPAPP